LPRHLYAFLAPQSAQIVHATMGEKKEKLVEKVRRCGRRCLAELKKKRQENWILEDTVL